MIRFVLSTAFFLIFSLYDQHSKAYAQECFQSCIGNSCTTECPSTNLPLPEAPSTPTQYPFPNNTINIPPPSTHVYGCQTTAGSCMFLDYQFVSNGTTCYCNAFPGLGGISTYLGQR